MWSSDDVFLFLLFWKCLSEYYFSVLSCDLMLLFLSFVNLSFVLQVTWMLSECYSAFRSFSVWDSFKSLLSDFLHSSCTLLTCDDIDSLIWHCMWWSCKHDLDFHVSQHRCNTKKYNFYKLWSFDDLCYSISNKLYLNLAFNKISSCILIL